MKKNKISRRKSLKVLALGSVGAGLMATSCDEKNQTTHEGEHQHEATGYQLSEEDKKLMETRFFTDHELLTVTVLADIIIPADEKSGSASDAGVPEFIEFMMKDQPRHQTRMRGGLKWLDLECLKRFEKAFVDCSASQQTELLDDIAYPETAKPEMSQGVAFFNMFRNFVASGFWTSEIGIADLEYKGNRPSVWEGAPKEWLDRLGVSYDS